MLRDARLGRRILLFTPICRCRVTQDAIFCILDAGGLFNFFLHEVVMLHWARGVGAIAIMVTHTLVSAQPQPNLIFILVDDLRYDALGFVNPGVQTPNLDALAAGGLYLPNAVVTTSLCSPSRATILTGQSARNHRIVDNNDGSEAGLTFFPSYLQEAGYETSFIGKWHMGRASDAPRPGFDHWVSFKGQGVYNPVPGYRLNVNGQPQDQLGYITDELTDYALEWLDSRKVEKPFFLYLSHKAVHADFQPAERHKDQYADVDIELPDPDGDAGASGAGKPMWVRNQRNSWHGVDFPYHSQLSIEDYVREYYAALSAVDESTGRIVAWLRDNDQVENTVVVFFSDNGFLFGDHGLIDKRNAYEPSVRVPMLVYSPGRVPPGVMNTRITNLDIAPTLLGFAGVEPANQMEGQSLVPLLTGATAEADWHAKPFVYEYYWEWTFPQTPTTFAITFDEIKYIQYHGLWDIEELYDLTKDPQERINLVHDADYLSALIDRRSRLFASLANNAGERSVPFREKRAQGLRFRREDGAETADFPESFVRALNALDLRSGFTPPIPPANEEK
jgi:arylsulfatase A-like enzyme